MSEQPQRGEVKRILNTENENRIGDVIFVHGLGGNAEKYWRPDNYSKDNSWLHWIGKELKDKDVGVWSIAYPANPFGYAMSLSERAENIINELQTLDLATKRPVVFITHSLGGLLVKQMLHFAMDGTVANAQTLIEQTKGIVFIATPHSGSDLANLVYILKFLVPTNLVKTLQYNQSDLLYLNTWFRNNFQNLDIQVRAFAENKKTPLKTPLGKLPFLKRQVVDPASAKSGLPDGVNIVPLDGDHISICKLKDERETLYQNSISLIKECFPIPIPPPVSELKTQHFPQVKESLERGSLTFFIGSGVNVTESEQDKFPPSDIKIAEELAQHLNLEEEPIAQKKIGFPCEICPVKVRENSEQSKTLTKPIYCPVITEIDVKQKENLIDEQKLREARLEIQCLRQANQEETLQTFNSLFEPDEYDSNKLQELLAYIFQEMTERGYPYNHPCQLIVTTNYDCGLEKAFDDLPLKDQGMDILSYRDEASDTIGRFYDYISYRKNQHNNYTSKIDSSKNYKDFIQANIESEEQGLLFFKRPTILKLYGGSLYKVFGNEVPQNSYYLADFNYSNYLKTETGTTKIKEVLPVQLIEHLKNSDILFIGYSANDPDLLAILQCIGLNTEGQTRQDKRTRWLINQSEPGSLYDKHYWSNTWRINLVNDYSWEDYINQLDDYLRRCL